MTGKSRAAVLTAPGEIEVRSVPLPTIAPDDGLLAVEACGVCGSDVPVYTGASDAVRPGVPFRLPVVLGHEIVGRIAEIGSLAAQRWGVSRGQRIVVERWLPCGRCDLCLSGDYRLCVPTNDDYPLFYGGTSLEVSPGLYGGYAQHLYLHPNSVVHIVPESVAAHHVPLFTPLGNAISWLQRFGGTGIGSHVVIIGPGQEGLCAVIAAGSAGAASITVVGLDADRRRLELSRQLGATATVILGQDDPVEVVQQATQGALADVVLDVTSAADHTPIELAVEVAGHGGRIVMASEHRDRSMSLRSDLMVAKLISLVGVTGRDRRSLRAAIALLASDLPGIAALPSRTYGLNEVHQAIEDVRDSVNDGHAVVVPTD